MRGKDFWYLFIHFLSRSNGHLHMYLFGDVTCFLCTIHYGSVYILYQFFTRIYVLHRAGTKSHEPLDLSPHVLLPPAKVLPA